MGRWTQWGILLMIGLFFAVLGFLMLQIKATNPYTGNSSSVMSLIIGWIFH